MVASPSRIVLFTLSKGLTERQGWAIGSFPEIMNRATGGSEGWTLTQQTHDEETGGATWHYEVQATPNIDLIVDHILHELTDAVLLSEWHSRTEDRFTFGSLRRDRPVQHSAEVSQAQAEDPSTSSG